MEIRGGLSQLRSDSIILNKPIQIEQLSGRPRLTSRVMECYHHHYTQDGPRSAWMPRPGGVGARDPSMASTWANYSPL